jgi:hypothetical protein
MPTPLPLIVAGLLAAAPLQASNMSGTTLQDAAADSAQVARLAFREAQSATIERATALLQRATTAWPTQPAYWLARARLAIRTADSATAREAIVAVMRLEHAPSLLRDSLLQRWIVEHTDKRLQRQLSRSAAPVPASVVSATVDSTVFVEGATIREKNGQLILSSLRQGTILACEASGQWRDLQLPRDPRIHAVFAVRSTPDDTTLWVTTAPHALHSAQLLNRTAASGAAGIARVHIANGTVVEWHPLPVPQAAHVPGDLLVLPSGDVLVSDSETARVYLWQSAPGAWLTVQHPGFRSLQGMALLPDGRRVIIADYSHGLYLLHLDNLSVHRIADAPATSVLGLDGLAWFEGMLYAVQNGGVVPQVVAISFTADFSAVQRVRVVDRQPTVAPAPSSIFSSTDGLFYVGNSPWSLFETTGVRTSEPAPPLTSVLRMPEAGRADRGNRSVTMTPSRPVPSLASCKRRVASVP